MEMLIVDANELKERLRKEQLECRGSNQFATSDFYRGLSLGYDYAISYIDTLSKPASLKRPKKADNTLMKYSKKELMELLREAEHNRDVAIEALEQQYQNVKDWEPVVYAEWKDCHGNTECSACGWETDDDYYLGEGVACPNCGARMKKKEGDTNEN